MASRNPRFHGRVEGARDRCAVPGCDEPGEFKAPLSASNFDGPGQWRFLCLEHVREHNAKYNFFNGMSPEEISEAQSPLAGWERATLAFAHAGSDPAPAWSADDFSIDSRHMKPGMQKGGAIGQKTINALFADGHAETVDARSAFNAIRNPGQDSTR